MTDLEREFVRAIAFAKAAEKKLGASFEFTAHVQWGFARIEWWGVERSLYEPYDDGSALAVIAPVVEGGDLFDHAAIDPFSQHVGLRLGVGHGLGLDAVEKARCRLCDLHLVERPLSWLRFPWATNVETQLPIEAVYLMKLSEADMALDRVHQITCASADFALRVQSLLPPSKRSSVVCEL
jgi:hypothetical protein